MGRKLKRTFLIIDDAAGFCRRICGRLNKLAKKVDLETSWGHENENSIEFRFVPMCPKRGETALEFKSRVRRAIDDDRKPEEERISNLAGIIVDLEFSMEAGAERFRGLQFAEYARSVAPHLLRILITNHDPDAIVEQDYQLFDWPQRKMSLVEDFGQRSFLDRIASELRDRYSAPFWRGLLDYAAKDKIVLHAMANTDSRTRRRSVTIDNFIEYFGTGYFKAEASATANPLDSLLHPVSTISEAEVLAAHAFGARAARFVTNGTTTSNKIVHQTISRAGSQTLLDRFCHISHHYAVCMTRSWPVYLNASVDSNTEVPSQIATDQPAIYIDEMLTATEGNGELPRLIAITNCTFDGFVIDPAKIFVSIRNVLRKHGCESRLKDIAFLFDEAWFGFARFHPSYSRFSSLTAREILCRDDDWWDKHLRLYVTQSMHKTMTSFRQGSMILINDPILHDRSLSKEADYLLQRLDNSFAAHTTTSPHAGMIASLDVGRRQMVFEGRDLLSETLSLAADFREFVNRIGERHLTADGQASISANVLESPVEDIHVDTTKLTLQTPGWIDGRELRQRLWSKYGIQVNKYGPNSVLCLFTIGIDKQAVSDLKHKIQSFLSTSTTEIATFKKSESDSAPFPDVDIGYLSPSGIVRNAFAAAANNKKSLQFDPGYELIGGTDVEREVLGLKEIIESNDDFLSTGFVVPYPPGYPILIPGQLINKDVANWLLAQRGREIHGLLTVNSDPAITARRVQGA